LPNALPMVDLLHEKIYFAVATVVAWNWPGLT